MLQVSLKGVLVRPRAVFRSSPNWRRVAAGLLFLVMPAAALADFHYVSISSSNPPVPPYLSWDDAATNIQDAISVAADSDTVWVADGTYLSGAVFESRIAITNRITVQSQNGPDRTTLDGLSSVRCAYLASGAKLSGFRLVGGYTTNNGGGAECQMGAVISNCIIQSNMADRWGGGVYQGFVFNSIIQGNRALGGGGVAGCQDPNIVLNCIIRSNSSSYGGGATYSWLRNCLVHDNTATSGAGGTEWCYLENCTVTFNVGSEAGGVLGASNFNSIVFSNSPPEYVSGGRDWWSFCCTTPHPGGTGNISSLPKFVYEYGKDFRLLSNSPCVNAGSNLPWMATATDLDGNPRIQGGIVDMGCYEFQRPTAPTNSGWVDQRYDQRQFVTVISYTDGQGLFRYEFFGSPMNPDWAFCLKPGEGSIPLQIAGATSVDCPPGWTATISPPSSVTLRSTSTASGWLANTHVIFDVHTTVHGWTQLGGNISAPFCQRFNPNNCGWGQESITYIAPMPGQTEVTLNIAGNPDRIGHPTNRFYGTHVIGAGTRITNSVESIVLSNQDRFVCSGWTGTGSVPASGTTNLVAFTVISNSTLTWNWREEHWLNLDASNGTITGAASGWKPFGYTCSLSPSNAAGYQFDHWQVNGTNAGAASPLAVTVTAAKTISAHFVPAAQTNSDPSRIVFENRIGGGSAALGWNGFNWVHQGQSVIITQRLLLEYAEFQINNRTRCDASRYISSVRSGDSCYPTVLTEQTGYSTNTDVPGWTRFPFDGFPCTTGTCAITVRIAEGSYHLSIGYGFSSTNVFPGGQVRAFNDAPPCDNWIAESMCRIVFRKPPQLVVRGMPAAYGSPAPFGYGTNEMFCTPRITNAVPATVVQGSTRRVCEGWTGTGDTPPSGSGNVVVFTIRTNSTLTWIWGTEHYLSVSAPNGEVGGATEGWKPEGFVYDLFPMNPAPGFVFDHWEVDGANAGAGVPLSLTMDQPRSLLAVFTRTFTNIGSAISTGAVRWTFNRLTGTCFETLELCNRPDSLKRLFGPFWYIGSSNAQQYLMHASGIDTNSGRPYLDLTSQVEAMLPDVGNGDLCLDPGECVTISNIEYYTSIRSAPTGYFASVWIDSLEAGMPPDLRADTDGDGIPNSWEDAHPSMNRNNPHDPNLDFDHDGVSNKDEYHADTDPDDGNSCLRFLNVQSGTIDWVGGVLATQYLDGSSDLSTWRTIRTNLPPTDIRNSFHADPGPAPMFYRVRVNGR